MKWILLAPLLLLGVLLGVFLLAMLLRAGVGAAYRGGELRVWIKIWWLRIHVFPRRKKKRRRSKQRGRRKKTSKRAKSPPKKQAPLPDTPKPAENWHHPADHPPDRGAVQDEAGLSVEAVCAYARFFVDSAKRMLRGLRVDKLWLRADIGTPDAAQTAIAYGSAAAAVSNLWPLLDHLLDIRKKDIWLNACFDSKKTTIEGEVVITAMVGRMALIGLRVFREYTKTKKAVYVNEQSQ